MTEPAETHDERATHSGPSGDRSGESPDAGDAPPPPRSTAELLRQLRDEFTLLLRQEIALAKAEWKETANRAAKSSLIVVMGVGAALVGIVLLAVAISLGFVHLLVVAGLGGTLANILGFLIGAILFAAGGGLFAYLGWKRLSGITFYPVETIDHLKKEAQYIKERM